MELLLNPSCFYRKLHELKHQLTGQVFWLGLTRPVNVTCQEMWFVVETNLMLRSQYYIVSSELVPCALCPQAAGTVGKPQISYSTSAPLFWRRMTRSVNIPLVQDVK